MSKNRNPLNAYSFTIAHSRFPRQDQAQRFFESLLEVNALETVKILNKNG